MSKVIKNAINTVVEAVSNKRNGVADVKVVLASAVETVATATEALASGVVGLPASAYRMSPVKADLPFEALTFMQELAGERFDEVFDEYEKEVSVQRLEEARSRVVENADIIFEGDEETAELTKMQRIDLYIAHCLQNAYMDTFRDKKKAYVKVMTDVVMSLDNPETLDNIMSAGVEYIKSLAATVGVEDDSDALSDIAESMAEEVKPVLLEDRINEELRTPISLEEAASIAFEVSVEEPIAEEVILEIVQDTPEDRNMDQFNVLLGTLQVVQEEKVCHLDQMDKDMATAIGTNLVALEDKSSPKIDKMYVSVIDWLVSDYGNNTDKCADMLELIGGMVSSRGQVKLAEEFNKVALRKVN